MSLLRQLLLSVTVVILLIVVGTVVFSINGARNYLSAQLQAESDNAATSLALLLSQPSSQDPAVREMMVSALFDSGRFQSIELRDSVGRELVARGLDYTGNTSVPQWFNMLLPLSTSNSTRHVSDGQTLVGELTVMVDQSAAKQSLWNRVVHVLSWVFGAGLAGLSIVIILSRWLQRSLRDEITIQVNSIVEGQATTPGKTHKQVVDLLPDQQVITQARERVQASRQEAADQIETLTLELNHDAVTGIPNRRYFMNELRRILNRDTQGDAALRGTYLLLCRQRDLAAIAQALPRDQVDAWLRDAGEALQRSLAQFGEPALQLGRLNGSDFAILIPQLDGPDAMLVAQAIRQALLDVRIQMSPGRRCRWAFAMTDVVITDDLTTLLSRLDTALMAAESAGHSEIETLLSNQPGELASHGVAGESVWRELLLTALAQQHVTLSVKQINYGKKRRGAGRCEATLSISVPSYNHGETLSGFSFMPAAVRLGLSADFDVRAIKLALAWLDENPGELVVRVSVPSLLRPEFLEALGRTLGSKADQSDTLGDDSYGSTPSNLKTNQGVLDRLIIELDAYGLAAYPSEVADFCTLVHDAGVRIGLRGVAQQLDTIARLEGLPVTYLKLTSGFMADLETSQGAMSLLNAVIHTATALRINVLVDDTPGDVAAMLLRDHGALLRT